MVSNAIRHFYVSSMGANSPIELFLLTSHFFQIQFLFVLISSESRLTLVIESDSLDLIFHGFFFDTTTKSVPKQEKPLLG